MSENSTTPDDRPSILLRLAMIAAMLLVGLVLVFVLNEGWGNFGDREKLVRNLEAIQTHPWAPVIVVLLFVVAGLIGVPLKLVLVGATVVMGPWMALGCGYAGSHLSALAGFGIGRRFGKPVLKKLPAKSLARLNRLLRDDGISAVLLVRLVPVAPFVVVNLAAGASHLRFRTFNLGTLIGIAPAISAVVLLTHTLEVAITRPDWRTILGFAVIFAFVVCALIYVHRALAERQASKLD